MSISFFATVDDLADLWLGIFESPGITVLRTYSSPDAAVEIAATPAAASELTRAGATQLSIHSSQAMPAPALRRFQLTDGRTRTVVEGCGLFSLVIGQTSETALCASSLSWFTESGARAKCSVQPGPDSVLWDEHKAIGSRFTSLVRRRLKVASVPGRSVLRGAAAFYAAGGHLKELPALPWVYALSQGAA